MKQKLSNEEKMKYIERYQKGESVKLLISEIGICEATFYNWIKKLNPTLSEDQNINSVYKLNKKIKKLSDILEIKSLVECTPSAPLKTRLYELEKLQGKYSVHSLCEALEVDRGTYYNHIKRAKKENAWYNLRRSDMKKLVLDVYDEHKQIFGANKIAAILKERGVKITAEYVHSIMLELGISSISTNSKDNYKKLHPKPKVDLLKMNFDVSAPNKTWVSDTTSFKINVKTFYICVIIDLFSRKVISYKISNKHSTNLVISTFKMALVDRNVDNLTFHSDKGSQFTSNAFMKFLSNLGVKQSFSPTASPYNNAVVESFFSYLKREEIYRNEYRSYNEFKRKIADYMIFYNNVRPHSYLRYKTPDKFEELYYKKLE